MEVQIIYNYRKNPVISFYKFKPDLIGTGGVPGEYRSIIRFI
jgi:hypothetical protein